MKFIKFHGEKTIITMEKPTASASLKDIRAYAKSIAFKGYSKMNKSELCASLEIKGKVKGAHKTKADPNKPKRGKSAYIFFAVSQRKAMKEEHEEASFGELGKLLGEMWRGMSEKEKSKYVKLSQKDKIRYENELKAYVPPQEAEVEAEVDEPKPKPVKQKAKPKPKAKKVVEPEPEVKEESEYEESEEEKEIPPPMAMLDEIEFEEKEMSGSEDDAPAKGKQKAKPKAKPYQNLQPKGKPRGKGKK